METKGKQRNEGKYIILIGCGILSVIFLYLSVRSGRDYHLVKSFMEGRIRWLNGFLAEVFDGSRPSLGEIEDHDLFYYLYLSYMGKFLGIKDAEHLFLIVQMLAYGMVLLIYPVVWYYLTKIWEVGFCVSIAVAIILRPMLWTYCNDSYWAMAWTVLIGIPLIAVFEKSYGAKKVNFLCGGGICLVIALGNIPRGHSSMGIALVFLAVLIKEFIKRYGDIKKVGIRTLFSIVIIMFFYQSFTNIIPNVYAYFNGDSIVMENSPAWHTLYVGLGWEENKYGITWDDTCGTEAARKIDPDVIHNTKEYHQIIKQVYLQLVKDDPIYILQSYTRKLIACIKVSTRYFLKSPYFLYKGILVCLTAILLLFNRYFLKRQKQFKGYGVLLVGTFFCGIQSLIFPMIAAIGDPYLVGTFAAEDLILFIMIVISIVNIYNAVLERRRVREEHI